MSILSGILAAAWLPTAGLSGMERWQGVRMPANETPNVGLGGYGEMIFAGALLVLLLGVLGLLIGRRRMDHTRARREFDEMSKQRGLASEEIELLRRIASLGGVGSLNMIFTLKPEFERGVSALLASDRISKLSENGRNCMVQLLNSLRQKLAFFHQLGAEGDMVSHTRQVPLRSLLSLTPPGGLEAVEARLSQCDPFDLVLEVEHPIETRAGDVWVARYCDGGSVWEFGAAVVRQKQNIVHFRHADNIRYINRRSFPRIPVKFPAKVAGFSFEIGDLQNVPPRFADAALVELAGVGIKLESPIDIPQGQRVLVILMLEDGKAVQSLAKVHRNTPAEGKYLLAAEMIGLSAAAITELTRLTNQAAIDHKKVMTAASAPMRPARAAAEVSHA